MALKKAEQEKEEGRWKESSSSSRDAEETITAAELSLGLASCMADVDARTFDQLIALYGQEDEMRESIIKRSRDVLKLAKQAIYSLHRRDTAGAERNLETCRKIINCELLPITHQFPALRFIGIFVGALEEWAEGCIFFSFLKKQHLPALESLQPLRAEEYLGGLMDFTGELNRFAVLRATERDSATVELCRQFVNVIHEKMLCFDLRNSPLRRKFDTLKYTEKKLESLCYEMQMAKHLSGIVLPSMQMEPPPQQQEESAAGQGAE